MIKLAMLPDRTPIKISITITPDLNAALTNYAEFYREAYGRDEPVADLIPAMLDAFLDGDKAFSKFRRDAPPRNG